MNAIDLFNVEIKHGFNYYSTDWIFSFWEIEITIACAQDQYYSDLDKYNKEDDRMCDICGTMHHTNEYGLIGFCKNESCTSVREFFGFTDGKRPRLASGKSGSERSARVQWLKKNLREHYGNGSLHWLVIYDYEIECRLPILLSMQLAREQNENARN